MVNFPGLGRTYAEYVAAPANQLASKSANTSFAEAGAATLAALTAWHALVTLGRVQAGQRVLVHAASGGVGHYAVQLARQRGVHIVATASAENRAFVLGLGAARVVDYQYERFEDVVAPSTSSSTPWATTRRPVPSPSCDPAGCSCIRTVEGSTAATSTVTELV